MNSSSTYQTKGPGKGADSRAFRLLISGGGTGGHVFPAIAIADAVRLVAPDTEVLFIGAKGRIEMERVPKAGYQIEGLWISGFQRKLTLKNLSFPFKLISSLFKANGLLQTFKPDVVVGVGGYASGPTLNRAQRNGIPTLIQEQNSFPGVTNRLLAKKADRICVAYEGMDRFFDAQKIRLTGNPVRQDLLRPLAGKEEAKASLGLPSDQPLVVIMGGSLGARSLNEAMVASHNLIASRADVSVVWQMGRLYEEEFGQTETTRLSNVKATTFLEDMPAIYAAADVLICRAGALTLSEICLLGQVAILVPSPNVAEDHQTKNAKALSENGAAILVPDSQAAADMIPTAFSLLQDAEKMESIARKAASLGKRNAGEEIANEILKLGSQNA